MTEQYQLEAVLATAEADCRGAADAFRIAQADLAKANAEWDRFVTDRRKAGSVRNEALPDRRKADADLAALSKAVTDRQNAYANLSKVEARWVKAEATLSKAEAEWVKAQAKLDMATVKLAEVTDALDRLDLSESKFWSSERVDNPIQRLGEASKRRTAASWCSTKSGGHFVRDEDKRWDEASAQRKSIHQFIVGLSMQDPNPRGAIIKAPLLRQAVGLLGLTLAYLQYYYSDVQLQISSLPSAYALLFQ
jgi:multidrug resistance efflux pump